MNFDELTCSLKQSKKYDEYLENECVKAYIRQAKGREQVMLFLETIKSRGDMIKASRSGRQITEIKKVEDTKWRNPSSLIVSGVTTTG